MDNSTQLSLLPLLIISLLITLVSYLLAKEKGRNVFLWTLLGAVPLVNLACIWFFVGAANLRLESKLDDLIERLK